MTAGPDEQHISDLISAGDLAAAYDEAMRAISDDDHSPQMRYLAVLALARMGAIAQARAAYDSFDIASIGSVDALSLNARLLKDVAFIAPAENRTGALLAAAAAYKDVFEKTGDPYPGVNAATLYRLAGKADQARTLAKELSRHTTITDPGSYYDQVTRAEILLNMDDVTGAVQALTAAGSMARKDHGSRATTRNQLKRLAEAAGLGESEIAKLLAPLASGTVIHFCGRMFRCDASIEARLVADIAGELDRLDVIAGYGALACGADILIAEALLKRGAELHVVLASSPQAFAATSVAPGGPGWTARYFACLEAASSLRIVGDDSYARHPSAFGFSTEIAIGLAIIRARYLASPVRQITIDDRDTSQGNGVAGSTADVARWQEAGFETIRIVPPALTVPTFPAKKPETKKSPERKALSLLFADFAGFTGLAENSLPDFWQKVLGSAAEALDEQGSRVVYRNTWGDACFAVFKEPEAAAQAAWSIQQRLAGVWQVPANSGMRISLHYGLVFSGEDPVLQRESIYGREVSRAARIEPITPPGFVYASENFAAACASRPNTPFRFGYVGRLTLPKNFGEERLYRLTRI